MHDSTWSVSPFIGPMSEGARARIECAVRRQDGTSETIWGGYMGGPVSAADITRLLGNPLAE